MAADIFSPQERATLERLPIALCVFALTGGTRTLLLASDGMCALLGESRAAVARRYGQGRAVSIHPDDMEAVRFAEAQAAGDPEKGYTATYRLRRADGAYLWVACRGSIELRGGVRLLFSHYTDVTNAREVDRLNRLLREKVEEYDMLTASTQLGIVKLRLDGDYTVLRANSAAYAAVGLTPDEFDRDFRGNIRRLFSEALAEDFEQAQRVCGEALARGAVTFPIYQRMPSRNGVRRIQGAGTFTDHGRDGRPTALFAVFTDVTEVVRIQERLAAAEKAAERAAMLRDENERLTRVLDNVPAGIAFFLVRDGIFENFTLNRYLVDMLGASGRELPVQTPEQFLSYVHPEDRPRCRETLRRFLSGRSVQEEVCRIRTPDFGAYRWTRLEGRLAGRPDGSVAAYLSFADVDRLKQAEAELRQSRRIYEETVRAARLVMWEYDIPARRIRLADNETTSEEQLKFGWTKVIENVPEALTEFIDPPDVPKFLAMFREVHAGRDAACDVWYKPQPGQEARCEHISYTIVRGPDGSPLRAYGMGRNITMEKNVEERYIRELNYLRQNDDYSLIAKGRCNLTANCVLEYSPLAGRAYPFPGGVSYDAACEAFLQVVEPLQERQAVAARISRESLIRRFQQGDAHTTLQYRRLLPEGGAAWISASIHTYLVPATGELECFIYSHDITEKKQTEEIMARIAEEEFEYIGLIHVQSRSFEFISRSEKIRFPGLRERTDYDLCCDYVRQNFVDPEERARFDEAVSLDRVLEALETSPRRTAIYRRTEGSSVLCEQVNYSWLDREAGLILVVRSNVTTAYEREQQQLRELREAQEAQARANAAKSAFLSSMSHDLRTPLNGVLGFTDAALRTGDEAKVRDYLKKIRDSGMLLLNLVNDTLELTKMEEGRPVLELEDVDSRDLGQTVLTALRPTAEQRGVALVASSLPCEILRADRLKLQKILLNLLSNAIKYTQSGGTVTLTVEPIDPPQEGRTRRIIVEDTGIGMSPEFLSHLFVPFTQERRPEAGDVPGTGLGLSIVKQLVDLMRGAIAVDSELGRGTRVTVELPVTIVGVPDRCDLPPMPATVALTGRRILLCEDNALNREIAELLLRANGMEVDSARDGSEGVAMFQSAPEGTYDLVLMDLRMPVLDGCGAAAAIRALPRADAAAVPILALSANAFEEDRRSAREAGMNGYLVKPVEPDALLRALQSYLGQKG